MESRESLYILIQFPKTLSCNALYKQLILILLEKESSSLTMVATYDYWLALKGLLLKQIL
jgi:hypothetical protein